MFFFFSLVTIGGTPMQLTIASDLDSVIVGGGVGGVFT